MSDFDYKQRPLTKEYQKGWETIFNKKKKKEKIEETKEDKKETKE